MDNVEKRKQEALKIQRDIVTEAIARDEREIAKKRARGEDAEQARWRDYIRPDGTRDMRAMRPEWFNVN